MRYRPLEGLIGKTVTIRKLSSISADVRRQLSAGLPAPIRFHGREKERIKRMVAKHGLLDLTFSVKGIEWTESDRASTPLLSELGLVLYLGQLDEDEPERFRQLEGEIAKRRTHLRLFLEEEPPRNLDEYFHFLIRSGKAKKLPEASSFFPESIPNDYFPRLFKVADACLTNAWPVWKHKHDYS